MKHFLKTAGFAVGFVLAASAAHAANMQCQPNQIITTAYPSGSTYTADAAGVVMSVSAVDVNSLHQAGCVQLGVQSGLCGELLNANTNVGGAAGVGDQPFKWFVPATQSYRLTKITAKNASRSFSAGSFAGGVYTAALKATAGGIAVVAASQPLTGLHATNATANVDFTLVSGVGDSGEYLNAPLWFSPTTADGTAGTIDLFVYCDLGN